MNFEYACGWHILEMHKKSWSDALKYDHLFWFHFWFDRFDRFMLRRVPPDSSVARCLGHWCICHR